MFARAHEFERLLGRIDASNVGVLLDLGHLNVTAETLGFEPSEFDSLVDRTVAIHVHGNDGSSDEHRPITGDDWAIQKLKDAYSSVDIPVVVESHFENADALAESVRALRSAL
jgi:sugar phosphate isomerase/epimerase